MKRLFIVFSLCIGSLTLNAQEKAVAKIHYIFKHVNDTTQRDKHLRDEVVTYLGTSSSYYSSYSSTRAQEDMQKQLNDPAFDGNLVISRNTTPVKESYFLDFANQISQEVRQISIDKFIIDNEFPTQDWEIREESKTIGGYEVQKATTHFKGRDYTAWFTTELPFTAGPWKLNGLPGLILEVYDTNKEVVFEYSGFDKLEDTETLVSTPEKALKSTEKEVNKLAEAYRANPQAYTQSKLGGTFTTAQGRENSVRVSGSGSTSASASIRVSGGSENSSASIDASKIKSMNIKNEDDYKPSGTTNNPIELTP
ncbi:GLPGLI family protein [Sphingobacterium wenxiniae]|uniref:GLPGLI family protein n=1 Tax=Sphingobacterium wenxiniae TaxID=683125 RepID=A0A1I6RBC2_9SPHI|nr:GLPGLI family protein [Sphingobacterium wenxiniae]SFS61976.1 GLPGLI family protein [Sphingobacterium wenxiniae]